MSLERVETFYNMSVEQFKTYASNILSYNKEQSTVETGTAYLQNVLYNDEVTLNSERKTFHTKRKLLKAFKEAFHDLIVEKRLDFKHTSSIFSQTTLQIADIISKLAQDNTKLYLSDNVYSAPLQIDANNTTVVGNYTGSAVGDTLNCGSSFQNLVINGNNTVISGIRFVSNVEKCISFGTLSSNLVLENCIFEGNPNDFANAKFFYGQNFTGNLTIRNCKIMNYGSWYLMDASTTSSTPTNPLDTVVIDKNYFKNCAGSLSVRGMQTNPTKLVQITSNLVEHETQHQYFWDTFEANNFIRLVCKDNTAIGVEHGDKRGFLQTWTRSAVPAIIEYKNNTLNNFKFALKTAHNTTFYAMNSYDIRNILSFDAQHTNVLYAYSALYKKNDGTTTQANKWSQGDFTPENISLHSSPPTLINPHGFNVVV